jgi:TonB family protein
MFNNLIESSSHAKEYKRRGSFLLFTGATYVLLFVVTGVVSIYAYDAHLEQQTTELELMSWVPQPPPEVVHEAPANPIRPTSNASASTDRPVRIQLIDSVSNPNNVPDHPGTTASTIPPAPRGAVLGPQNIDPIGPPPGTRGTPGGTGDKPVVPNMPDEPPPAPTPAPAPPKILKVSRVLNSQALSLPPPTYPPLARQTRTQGTVIVQVLIDEEGKVVSAKATAGHPLLVPEAQKAALRARFSPTVLGDQKVKVQGVITYNFVLGN